MVRELVSRDPNLWLSRSWTTRDRRPGEPSDAYRFVSREEFEAHSAAGGFLEWAEFLGHLYGTPRPDPDGPDDVDILLEIDVQGAAQVTDADPEALLVFLDAPSVDEQVARLRGRGDPPDKVAARVEAAAEERARSEALGATTIVNDDLDLTVAALVALIDAERARRR